MKATMVQVRVPTAPYPWKAARQRPDTVYWLPIGVADLLLRAGRALGEAGINDDRVALQLLAEGYAQAKVRTA